MALGRIDCFITMILSATKSVFKFEYLSWLIKSVASSGFENKPLMELTILDDISNCGMYIGILFKFAYVNFKMLFTFWLSVIKERSDTGGLMARAWYLAEYQAPDNDLNK